MSRHEFRTPRHHGHSMRAQELSWRFKSWISTDFDTLAEYRRALQGLLAQVEAAMVPPDPQVVTLRDAVARRIRHLPDIAPHHFQDVSEEVGPSGRPTPWGPRRCVNCRASDGSPNLNRGVSHELQEALPAGLATRSQRLEEQLAADVERDLALMRRTTRRFQHYNEADRTWLCDACFADLSK